MNDPQGRTERAVAVVGIAAILPDAPDAAAFWKNVREKRYSISDVPDGRWSAADYYDADPAAPDKTYSRIGGWVRGFAFDWKRFHIPPRVASMMDESQQWAVTIAEAALADYGYPKRPLDTERTAVVLGTAMGGEMHDLTTLRICFPEFSRALGSVSEFLQLPAAVRQTILSRWHEAVGKALPPITEDTMPGELANIVAGRVANVLNLRGPNFITDAACASTFAAVDAAVDLLVERHCDAVLTGGVDRNMGIGSFVKFCKIGALSATGTRPFGDGADGFVMGEGAAAFLLKRLADAERDGDRVYAVIRGVGGSSDGRGKGITAPNPIGQRLATSRAWEDAGLDPATATLIEAHGTSTKVGDVVEVESLHAVFGSAPRGAIALGSVKSNFGHLKAGAGAAGLLKAVLAVHERVLPPTLNAEKPNPAIDFAATPFVVNHELREWPRPNGNPRRAGVSAYGFGGTNFHVVLEEHVPGMLTSERKTSVPVGAPAGPADAGRATAPGPRPLSRPPLRGIAALGASSPEALKRKAEALLARAKEGVAPPVAPPSLEELRAPERLVLDYDSPAQLADRLHRALKAMDSTSPAAWRRLQGQGVFRGSGARSGKLAFLFPGQGSQYLNMGRELAAHEPVVKAVFDEADQILTPVLGRSLTSLLWADPKDEEEAKAAEAALMQTAVTQPAVLSVDAALARLLGEFGIRPDVVMGHSLGEYGAHVAAGTLPFADALEAAAARGREMTRVSLDDNGCMAAVMAPLDVVERTLPTVGGYVVAANINSRRQCVIGGATSAVQRAIEVFGAMGFTAQRLPVSHAFHTKIVAPASAPLRQVLDRLRVAPPVVKVVSNVTGGFYPDDVDGIKDLLERQVASPVQWVMGLEAAYADGVRTFVEVGPKRVLKGFADDVFEERPDVVTVYTNHTKPNETAAFNYALCALYAAGYGVTEEAPVVLSPEPAADAAAAPAAAPADHPAPSATATAASSPAPAASEVSLDAISRMLQDALARVAPAASRPYDRNEPPLGSIVISGTGLGLPGAEKPVMDPANAERILRGEQFVDLVPERYRRTLATKHVTRIVKSEDGSGHFETIDDTADVIKLAGRPGSFDLAEEYGVPPKLIEALDTTTQLAMAAGLDALREAGIPLVQTFRKTTTGKYLPDRWLLPEALRDDTGVIFASAFPGYERFADELTRYNVYEGRRELKRVLEDLRLHTQDPAALAEIQRKLAEVEEQLAREPYGFDRRFLFRVLNMGHSQFAEYVGARGPNATVNAACASTAQGIALAEDWIRSGRCRRVVVIGADNVTSPRLFEWIGSGFLATGAAATDDKIEEAALPFDRRRHGTLLGMGACALVVESQDSVEERGMRGIVELLSSETRNSAYHATRLDVHHIADVVESLITSAERRFGIGRMAMAPQTVFVSHETFTPARGGSAAAEVEALRKVFGAAASAIVVANTKGFTGHPMGVGIEDVIGVKILEHGIVPPVPNYKEVDPDLGTLNLSRGGRYAVRYAIHLAAGFGSQIALTLTRRVPGGPDRVDSRAAYERWLADVSGNERAETEVVKRVLRVASQGAPSRLPAPSAWRPGTGPSRRTPVAEGAGSLAPAPSPGLPAASPRPAAPPPPPAPAPVSPPERPAEPPAVAPAPSVPRAAAPAIVAAPAAGPAAPSAESVADQIAARVLRIVAEKTGYPPEMLEMDLDLEADLGVDTVKQAEVFAAVREAWDIPRQETLKLRDFPTLRHVVKFVLDSRPDLAAPAGAGVPSAAADGFAPSPALAAATAGTAEPQAAAVAVPRAPIPIEKADLFPRRVPVPALRPSLELCKPTGVSIGRDSRVLIGGDAGGVAKALARRLEKSGAAVTVLDPRADETFAKDLAAVLAKGPLQGVFWLPALDPEPPLPTLDLAGFRELNRSRVKHLYALARAAYDSFAAPGSFLVSATRMGGFFGHGPEPASAPLGGGVLGFTKALKHERPSALVKAVDFESSAAPSDVAEALVSEALSDPGEVEVGHARGRRFTLSLEERPARDGGAGLSLDRDTVFVVTGAAGGITSAIVADLAAASGGVFHLLDLAPRPTQDDPHVALLRQDRDRLKAALIEEARSRGEKVLPPAIEKQILDVERRDAASRVIEAVTSAGGRVEYRSLDLRDAKAVAEAVADVREAHGRIDVLIHAGGIEISRDLPQKEPAEFERVFDIKVEGFFNLLKVAEGMPIGATVVFSSVAGRFGNAGQTDYSAANALLCSLSSHLRALRVQTRPIAIDWTAWDGIGMATRGSIPKIMEAAGIEMLPPEVGIPTVRRELVAGAGHGEVVVAGRLGILGVEWDETGGLDVEKANAALAAHEPPLVMAGRLTRARLYGGLEAETMLDPKLQPFLHDHAIDGTPLLPGVMACEAFAEAALVLAPGLRVVALEDVVFDKPLKYYRNEPAAFFVELSARPGEEEALLVRSRLTTRIQPNPDLPPVEKLHFTGTVRLDAKAPRKTSVPFKKPALKSLGIGREAIYQVYFHGPAYRVLERARVEGDEAVGLLTRELPPNAAPPHAASLVEPRLVELLFQTAGLWEIVTEKRLALPSTLPSLRVLRSADKAEGRLFALVRREGNAAFSGRVVDEAGTVFVEIAGYRSVTFEEGRSLPTVD